jgi:hypothetical protein
MIIMSSFILQKNNVIFYFILQKNNVIFYFTQEMALRHQHAEKHAEQNKLVHYNTMHNNINNYVIMITLLKSK